MAVVRWEEMMSTCLSRAKVMTSSFVVCELCPLSSKITGSYSAGFVFWLK